MYSANIEKRSDQLENFFVTLLLFCAPWIISFAFGLEGYATLETMVIKWRLILIGLAIGLPFAFICYIMSKRNKA